MELGAHGFICNRLSALLSDVNMEGEGTHLRENPPVIFPLPSVAASVLAASSASSSTSTPTSSALVGLFYGRSLCYFGLFLLCLTTAPTRIANERWFGSLFVHLLQFFHHRRREELLERCGEIFGPDITLLHLNWCAHMLGDLWDWYWIERRRGLRLGSALLGWNIV